MQLYLIRHGDAVDRALADVATDEERWLTEEGRQEVQCSAQLMAKLDVQIDLILSSPLVRAWQTAEIIAEIAAPNAESAASQHLIHGGSFSGILDDLRRHGNPAQVALTGHMPSIGALAGWLCWNQRESGIRMRTAEVARIDLPDDRVAPGWGDLRWLMAPQQARKLIDG